MKNEFLFFSLEDIFFFLNFASTFYPCTFSANVCKSHSCTETSLFFFYIRKFYLRAVYMAQLRRWIYNLVQSSKNDQNHCCSTTPSFGLKSWGVDGWGRDLVHFSRSRAKLPSKIIPTYFLIHNKNWVVHYFYKLSNRILQWKIHLQCCISARYKKWKAVLLLKEVCETCLHSIVVWFIAQNPSEYHYIVRSLEIRLGKILWGIVDQIL